MLKIFLVSFQQLSENNEQAGCGPSETHLNLNVPDFSCRANDRPADQRRENVLRKVGTCIATLHKLHTREKTE